MDLLEQEKQEIKAYLDRGEPLPEKDRWKLFATPRETELIWPGNAILREARLVTRHAFRKPFSDWRPRTAGISRASSDRRAISGPTASHGPAAVSISAQVSGISTLETIRVT